MIRLENIVDFHEGEKFLVCGTGPSIDQFSREFYTEWGGITIGVNNIENFFTPDYYLNVHREPRILWMQGFIYPHGHKEAVAFDYCTPSTQIATEKNGRLSMTTSVAIPATTAAYQLGASEIYLIGIDLNLGSSGQIYCDAIGQESHEEYSLADPNHFEFDAVIRSFRRIAETYRNVGVDVYNLSQISRLEGIEKVNWYQKTAHA